jgi:predicted CopG family antitoxin
MSSKQTRRSVSISGEAYAQLKEHCAREGASMSGTVEEMIRRRLAMPQRGEKVEVIRTVATAPVHPKAEAKPKNGTRVVTADASPRTYGMTEKQLAERRAKIEEAHRRAGNIFTF